MKNRTDILSLDPIYLSLGEANTVCRSEKSDIAASVKPEIESNPVIICKYVGILLYFVGKINLKSCKSELCIQCFMLGNICEIFVFLEEEINLNITGKGLLYSWT